MKSLNIGEARITRDHNIDRKETCRSPATHRVIRLAAARQGARARRRGADRAPMIFRSARPPAGAAPDFRDFALLDGKLIPLFLKML
jgi:hypothetical protein